MEAKVSVAFMLGFWGSTVDEFVKRLLSQKIDFSFEIVVAYYGKDEGTFNKIKSFADKVVWVKPDDYNCGSTRDAACNLASGQFIVTLSVDSLPLNNHWLDKMIEPLLKNKADIVQGAVQCPEQDDVNYPDYFYWEKNYGFYFTSEGEKFYEKYGCFGEFGNYGFAAPNLAFSRKLWKKTGFSGARYNGDNVFQKKVAKYHPRIVYKEDAIVLHAHSYKTIRSLFNRCSNEGLGWRDIGEEYGLLALLKDLSRIDLHFNTINAWITRRLKHNSEILFHLIRPIALYWGNNFAKSLYSDRR